jgi:hypothetical protein
MRESLNSHASARHLVNEVLEINKNLKVMMYALAAGAASETTYAVSSGASSSSSENSGVHSAGPRLVSSQLTSATSHDPYTKIPTATGAVSHSTAGADILILPSNLTALTYCPNVGLKDQIPIPYQPTSGLATNGTEPVYRV